MKRILTTLLLSLMLCAPAWAQEEELVYIQHKVRWLETIYSIARKYKVDAKELVILNDLPNGEIKRGQILLIPDRSGRKPASSYTQEPDKPEQKAEEPEEPTVSPCLTYVPSRDSVHTLSLVLPLSNDRNATSFLEFYQGALLAVQDAKQLGMSAVVQCFDWNAYASPELLVADSKFSRSDVVIGPVFAAQLNVLLKLLEGTHTLVVSPLDAQSESLATTNPHFFQVRPTYDAQQDAMLQLLRPSEASIWLLSETGEETLTNDYKALLDTNGISYQTYSYDVLHGREVASHLKTQFSTDRPNQVIIASNNEAFVSDAIRNLHLLSAYSNIPVELFGLSKWRSFETLDLEALHQLQIVFPVPLYIDYDNASCKQFVRTFRSLYFAEPSQYAFQGYDVTRYFLEALYRLGPQCEDCIETLSLSLLQTDFRFRRQNEKGGFLNEGTRLVRYLPDYSVTSYSVQYP